MKTTVINIKDAPAGWQTNPDYVFCGRPNARQKTHKLDGRYGNPYRIGRDGTRDEVVDKHRALIFGSEEAKKDAPFLKGKKLVCPGNCKPERCHCDNWKDLAEQLHEEDSNA